LSALPFPLSDALSGNCRRPSVASPLLLSTESANVHGQVGFDPTTPAIAALSTSATRIRQCRIPPPWSRSRPANGATYGFYQDVLADFSWHRCLAAELRQERRRMATWLTPDRWRRHIQGHRRIMVTFTTAVHHSFTVDAVYQLRATSRPAIEAPTLNLVSSRSIWYQSAGASDGNGGFVSNAGFISCPRPWPRSPSARTVVPLNLQRRPARRGINFDAISGTSPTDWATNRLLDGLAANSHQAQGPASLHELRFKFQ